MAFGSGLVMAMAMPPMAQCQREAYALCGRRASRLMQHGRWLLLWYKTNREEIFLEERYGAQVLQLGRERAALCVCVTGVVCSIDNSIGLFRLDVCVPVPCLRSYLKCTRIPVNTRQTPRRHGYDT